MNPFIALRKRLTSAADIRLTFWRTFSVARVPCGCASTCSVMPGKASSAGGPGGGAGGYRGPGRYGHGDEPGELLRQPERPEPAQAPSPRPGYPRCEQCSTRGDTQVLLSIPSRLKT